MNAEDIHALWTEYEGEGYRFATDNRSMLGGVARVRLYFDRSHDQGCSATFIFTYFIEDCLGWATGIEPATFGATDRRSTS